jgi:hypothetical protein
MKQKEVFLDGCHEISKAFEEHGFKPIQKGQKLRKIADDKDMFYEIYFSSSVERNNSDYVKIEPNLWIFSKKLKIWIIEQTKNEHNNGIICTEKIRTPEAPKRIKEWNLAGEGFDNAVNEIVNAIEEYFVPIIEIFKDKITAIEYLKKNGTKFNEWAERTLLPMAFMIHFGGKEAAEIFLKDYIENKNSNVKEKITNLYSELSKMKRNDIKINFSEFVGAGDIKLAFVNGIKI